LETLYATRFYGVEKSMDLKMEQAVVKGDANSRGMAFFGNRP
jgi:hypothetical protein